MNALYLSSAQGCMELQEKMGRYGNTDARMYLDKEADICAILAEMPTRAQIEEMLALVDLHMDDFYAAYGEKKVQDAVLYAKDLKDRYTVLWLYYDLMGEKYDV